MNQVENYVGQELELFATAVNWKDLFGSHIAAFVKGDVLEVGAGIGANTPVFFRKCGQQITSWTALEPDAKLCAQIPKDLDPRLRTQTGTLSDNVFANDEKFDAILYLDVLEHIEDDNAEVARALSRLKPGGHLIVLAPAHNSLFSPFDKSVGHFRRYDKPMMRALRADGAKIVCERYLDSCGLLLSFANRALLKQSYPNARQIWIWDTFVVAVSRFLDRLFLYSIGKSVLFVWKKN